MDRQQELTLARQLLKELRSLGVPCPSGLDDEQLLQRYRALLEQSAAPMRGAAHAPKKGINPPPGGL